MWLIALFGLLLAVTSSLDAYGIFATVLTVLAVAAHLIGAAIGHRLRDNGDRPLPPKSASDAGYLPLSANEFAPATSLSERRGPSKWVVWNAIVWCLLGAIAGGILLGILCGEKANVTNIGAGAIAFAVLGAIWGFALGAFFQETIGAWWQAQKTK